MTNVWLDKKSKPSTDKVKTGFVNYDENHRNYKIDVIGYNISIVGEDGKIFNNDFLKRDDTVYYVTDDGKLRIMYKKFPDLIKDVELNKGGKKVSFEEYINWGLSSMSKDGTQIYVSPIFGLKMKDNK